MKYEIRDGKNSFRFENGVFSLGTFDFPVEGLFRSSTAKPWNLEAEKVELKSASVSGNTLTALWHSKRYAIGLEWTFTQNILRGRIAFTAQVPQQNAFAALAFPIPDAARLVMPMALYNNNPAAAPDKLAAKFPPSGNASLLLEESRFPIPGVNAEFDGQSLSLFLMPGHQWSLGAERVAPGKTVLLLGSGCVSYNGRHDFACRCKNHPMEAVYGYRDLAPGDTMETEFALTLSHPERFGEGFRDLVHCGYQLFQPKPEPCLSYDEMRELKMCALRERWDGRGYLWAMPDNLYGVPPRYQFGWSGQFIRLAFCDLRNGVEHDEPEGIQRALTALNFFLDNSQTPMKGLRYPTFDVQTEKWICDERPEVLQIASRSLGETWYDTARFALYCKKHSIALPDTLLPALTDALEFTLAHLLPEGITPITWELDGSASTAELSSAGSCFAAALFAAAELTGEKRWFDAADAMLRSYWRIGGDRFDTPFSRATLDAGCEDKEAAINFFIAAALGWRLTGNPDYRHFAEASADWLLTWVYFWNVPLRPGSICDKHHFRSVGWPTVSVENQHLDVFFPAWEMTQFGVESGNPFYEKCGKMIFEAWSHGISKGNGEWLFVKPGRQPEQFFQTDWVFSLKRGFTHYHEYIPRFEQYGYTAENVDELNPRGGANPWDVSWIIALVLDAALSFTSPQWEK